MAETTPKAAAKKTASKTAQATSEAKATKATKTATAAKTPRAPQATAATGAPAAKKPRAKKAAAAEAPIALVVVPKPVVKNGGKAMVVSDEQRYRMVAEAAYYRAESNQFKSDPVRDWIEAENDIAALLSGSSR